MADRGQFQHLRAVRIEPVEGHHSTYYDHYFFRHLAAVFPRSRYAEYFCYATLPFGEVGWVMDECIAHHLIDYLRRFPTGRYATRAKMDLAIYYDSVWVVLRGDSPWQDRAEACSQLGLPFTCTDAVPEQQRAQLYRRLASSYYEELRWLKATSPEARTVREIRELEERLGGLRPRSASEWPPMNSD